MQHSTIYKAQKDILTDPDSHPTYVEAYEILTARYGAVDFIPDAVDDCMLRVTVLFTNEQCWREFAKHNFMESPDPIVRVRYSCEPRYLTPMLGAAAELLDDNEIFQRDILFLPRQSSQQNKICYLAKSESVADCFVDQAAAMFNQSAEAPPDSPFCYDRLSLRGNHIMRQVLLPPANGPV